MVHDDEGFVTQLQFLVPAESHREFQFDDRCHGLAQESCHDYYRGGLGCEPHFVVSYHLEMAPVGIPVQINVRFQESQSMLKPANQIRSDQLVQDLRI